MKFFFFAACLLTTATVLFAGNDISKVSTDNAPKAIGPYSQAVRAGQYLFVSGQLPIDPATGQFAGNTVEEQTQQILNNIEAILHAEGLTFENIVKAEVYMKDLADFKSMNGVYAARITQDIKPARQTMQVSRLPMDALLEISCIAFAP